MARTKVRNYLTTQQIIALMNEYFEWHADEVIQMLLEKYNCKDIDELRELECSCYFGFDCGWVWLYPLKDEQKREWRLDNYGEPYAVGINPSFYCQSTTIKEVEIRYALQQLGLDHEYGVKIVLD